MNPERLQRRHEDMAREIKDVARRQIAENGAAALSLGAVARELGVTTAALYHYIDGRDALVSALIIDALDALGDRLERAGAAGGSLGQRYERMLHAYREWALCHPQDYILVHGAIFPGYEVPEEVSRTAGTRPLLATVRLLLEAQAAGCLCIPEPYCRPHGSLKRLYALFEAAAGEGTAPLITLSFVVWNRVHALVWGELAGLARIHYAGGEIFAIEARRITEELGLYGPGSGDPS